MPETISTTVYTYAELVEMGDGRAAERAREWWWNASEQDACDDVSEQLTEALREAYGPRATVEGWDYCRNSVTIGGVLARPSESGDGPAFRGWHLTMGHGTTDLEVTDDWPVAGDYMHQDRNYIGRGWIGTGEDDYVTAESLALCEDYVRAVESVLVALMCAEFEYRESDEYIAELMEANGYTFTAEGRRFG